MITAGLATYNNSDIIWLQLESLCRQVNAPEWELIIVEEPSKKYFSKKGIDLYRDRLKAANCVNIRYIVLDYWVPLSQKWLIIRNNMHPESVGMMLCASDNWSAPNRIELSHKHILQHDWIQWQSGYFYNILSNKTAIYNTLNSDLTGLFMCISKRTFDRVDTIYFPTRGIDTWLSENSKSIKFNLPFDGLGVHTDGFNTISHNRRDKYGVNLMYKEVSSEPIYKILPYEVQERLYEMAVNYKKLYFCN